MDSGLSMIISYREAIAQVGEATEFSWAKTWLLAQWPSALGSFVLDLS